MANFPGSLPSIPTSSASQTLALAAGIGHTALHNLIAGEVLAIATKVGTGTSTPASGQVLRGTGAGTSAWGQVALTSDVTGTLPVANGGTGQNSLTALPLPSPAISGTVSGGATYTSPILTAPTITDYTNANHSHQNASGGGLLAAAAMPNLALNMQSLSNPYKFLAYNNAVQNLPATSTKHAFNTEVFDTNGNYDTTLSRYTAPVSGFYNISAHARVESLTGLGSIYVYKNGSPYVLIGTVASGGVTTGGGGSFVVELTVSDYIEIFVDNTQGTRNWIGGSLGQQCNYFSGYLVSQT